MTALDLDKWGITPSHHSAFVRHFDATPKDIIMVDFETSERRGNRFIDAVYPALVKQVLVRFQWDETNGFWWGQAVERLAILNEQTGEPYKSGWRADRISRSYSETDITAPSYVRELINHGRPRSRITVVEEPVS